MITGFPKDRKELILQYLSGLASRSCSSDQMVVKEFLLCLGSSFDVNDALDYLKSVQKMKGEWYNQQGKCNPEVVVTLVVKIVRILSRII